MLDGILGGILDIEGKTRNKITEALEDLADELNVPYTDLFVVIQPSNDKFDFRLFVYKIDEGKKILEREVALKEIVS